MYKHNHVHISAYIFYLQDSTDAFQRLSRYKDAQLPKELKTRRANWHTVQESYAVHGLRPHLEASLLASAATAASSAASSPAAAPAAAPAAQPAQQKWWDLSKIQLERQVFELTTALSSVTKVCNELNETLALAQQENADLVAKLAAQETKWLNVVQTVCGMGLTEEQALEEIKKRELEGENSLLELEEESRLAKQEEDNRLALVEKNRLAKEKEEEEEENRLALEEENRALEEKKRLAKEEEEEEENSLALEEENVRKNEEKRKKDAEFDAWCEWAAAGGYDQKAIVICQHPLASAPEPPPVVPRAPLLQTSKASAEQPSTQTTSKAQPQQQPKALACPRTPQHPPAMMVPQQPKEPPPQALLATAIAEAAPRTPETPWSRNEKAQTALPPRSQRSRSQRRSSRSQRRSSRSQRRRSEGRSRGTRAAASSIASSGSIPSVARRLRARHEPAHAERSEHRRGRPRSRSTRASGSALEDKYLCECIDTYWCVMYKFTHEYAYAPIV